MTRWRQGLGAIGLVAALAAGVLQPSVAEARGRRGGAVFLGGGFHAFSPWGFGFGPYWGWGYPPAYYQPAGGVDMNVAMMAGWGAIELNVKPDRADVWVDGLYMGEARDLDGYPSYLWLEKGGHRIVVYKGGFRTFEDDIEIARGMKRTLKIKMEAGESGPPPAPKPSLEPKGDGPREKRRERGGAV